MKVFLAHSFRPDDRHLVADIERLLASHDVRVSTGRVLGGGALTEQVMRRIDSAVALVAVMTRAEQIANAAAAWRTHPWVEDELGYGRAKGKRAICLVESGVALGGAYASYERIELDRSAPLDAVLTLSEVIRVWKTESGWSRHIQLKPDQVGHALRTRPELSCRYRFVTPQGQRTEWRATDPITQPSGTVVYLDGICGEDHYIEIEVRRGDAMEWYSPATAQQISVELRPRNGGANAD